MESVGQGFDSGPRHTKDAKIGSRPSLLPSQYMRNAEGCMVVTVSGLSDPEGLA